VPDLAEDGFHNRLPRRVEGFSGFGLQRTFRHTIGDLFASGDQLGEPLFSSAAVNGVKRVVLFCRDALRLGTVTK
jgi:hypothetical protein